MIVRRLIANQQHQYILPILCKQFSLNANLCKKLCPQHQMTIKKYSRFSANTILTGTDMIRFTDYDCIGFDLDNTLLRYNLTEMVELEYNVLAKYLIEHKGYPESHLNLPMKDNIDFLQRGLIIDFARGNILKIAYDGYISMASHGTKQLTENEIITIYGPKRMWNVTSGFCVDLLQAWHGSLAEDMRALLDYFDMPASLVFARIVDTLDEQNGCKPLSKYHIWHDILDGLGEIFTREHFENNRSEYFASVKANPSKFIRRSSDSVRNWLKELKKHRTVFLLTGSHIDFANLTATHAFGDDWRDLFDIVICFAKKPGFFTLTRPFKELNGFTETTKIVNGADLQLKNIYSQGNWSDLMHVLAKKSKKLDPKVLYVGDNLVQDVYAPNTYCHADTISVAEEMHAEGMQGIKKSHDDQELLTSKIWGTYFFSTNDEPSIWLEIIRKHSKVCVPSVDWLAEKSIDEPFKCFSQKMCTNGFHPGEPNCFSN